MSLIVTPDYYAFRATVKHKDNSLQTIYSRTIYFEDYQSMLKHKKEFITFITIAKGYTNIVAINYYKETTIRYFNIL